MSLRRFFRRSKADSDLSQEMDLYLAEEIDENLARGMKPAEARRRAYVKLGNPQRVRETLWKQNTVGLLESIWRDFRYATRTLSRAPGFAVIAVLVMALGIGANVALFTVVRSVLLNPLPYRDPGRLYSIYERESKHPEFRGFMPVDAGSIAVWQESTRSVAQIAFVSPWQQYNVSSEGT